LFLENMSQRVILLTGANGGLGQSIARAFLDESVENFIWLAVYSGRNQAQALAEEFANRCALIDLDVTKSAAWKSVLERILEKHKRIDVLVNNAGRHQDNLLATMPENVWHEVVSTNLDAVFHGCRAVLPTMISQRSGRIVNVSSISALFAPAGQANYAAAKAGVLALTRCLAKEVARIGITVNAVCPGYIETDALAAMNGEERQRAQTSIPMRRFGNPREVAAAVRFLACPDASYITGSVMKVDGGIL
jgi:3-oxoacyl-[acyl-carrier protein] reductase